MNSTRPAVRDGRVDVARGRGAVDLDLVGPGVAVHDVGAVAVVPDEHVVAGPAFEVVGAPEADDAVVAAVAAQVVVARPAGEQVVSIATVDGERGVIGRRERARVDGVGAIACVDDDLGVAVGGEGRRLAVDRDDPAGGGEGDRVGRLIARHRQGVGVHGLGDRGAGAGRCGERCCCYGGDQRRCLGKLLHEISFRLFCVRCGRPPVMLGMANVVVRRQPSSGRAGSLNASPCLRAMSRSLAVIAAIIWPNGTPHIGHIP